MVEHPGLDRDPAAGGPHHAERAGLLGIVDQRRGADQPVAGRAARPGCGGCGPTAPRSRAGARRGSRAALAALGAGERLVRDDDHPAAPSGSRAGWLASRLVGADQPARAAAAAREVEHDQSKLAADVHGGSREVGRAPAARRGACDDLERLHLGARRRIGRDAHLRAGQRLREELVNEARAAADRRATRRRSATCPAAAIRPGGSSHRAWSPSASARVSVGRCDLAGDEDVVVAEHRVHRRARAEADERPRDARQQPRMLRSVEVGAVVERIRVARQLDAVVAGRGRTTPAAERGQRPPELVALVVVDQVAALDDRVRAQRPDRARSRPRAPARSAPPGGGTSTRTAGRGDRGTAPAPERRRRARGRR